MAILRGRGNRAQVVLCSKEAATQRVYAGMKLSEAKAVCSDLLVREYDEKLYGKFQTHLLHHLVAASPKISSVDFGTFLIDAAGLTHLGGESRFCLHVQKLINTSGYPEVQIGIADSAFAAQVASKSKAKRHCVVPAGKDREFLSKLSVQHLPVDPEMQESLYGLGIKTIGQLLELPTEEVLKRFGNDGLKALELAQGNDQMRAQIVQPEVRYESYIDLSFPVESLQQTQFILKSMLEQISNKLKENSLLAEELEVTFFNDNDKFDERTLKLLRPSSNTKFLLEIVKLSLEANPLIREYTGLHIVVSRFAEESWWQNKVRVVDAEQQSAQAKLAAKISANKESTAFVIESNSELQAEPFALLLQRFMTRLGAGSIVRPVANDQHLPDEAGKWLPLSSDNPGAAVLPIDISFMSSETGPSALACGLILKKSPDPEVVLVEYSGKTPTAITYQGRWHRIKELTEPEKLSGLWWEKPVRKSYFIALIESASDRDRAKGLRAVSNQRNSMTAVAECDHYLVLLVHDHETNCWQLEGFFD